MQFQLKHPRRILFLWVLLSLALGALGLYLGQRTVLAGPAATQTLLENPGEQRARAKGLPLKDTLIAVLAHPALKVSEPEFTRTTDSLVELLRAQRSPTGVAFFERVQSAGYTFLGDEHFTSEDAHAVLIRAPSSLALDQAAMDFHALSDALEAWQSQHAAFSLSYVSQGTSDHEVFDLINRDLDRSLLLTLPLTFLVLLWAFGSLVAALVPLLIALVSLIASLGASAVVSHLIEPISATASQLVVLLVLAVGVDYSLFLITRVREQVALGSDYPEALASACAHTGVAIFWAGITVAVSMVGLLLMRDSILTSMALVSILAVLLTLLGALSALPALLMLLGARLEYGRLLRRAPSARPRATLLLRLSIERPLPVLLCAGGFVIALALFCGSYRLGTTMDPTVLPASLQSVRAFRQLEKTFPDVAGVDFSLVLEHPSLRELDEQGELQAFFDALLAYDFVRGPQESAFSDDGTLARYRFTALGGGNSERNLRLVSQTWNALVLERLEPLGVKAYLGGTLPFIRDAIQRYSARTPLVFAAVLAVSMLFLLLAFRSIVVPLKAVILNLLSASAAFGATVLLFQHGVLGVWHYGVIESFVPPLLFCILFGLSMDYHVMLLARVREEVKKGFDTRSAVLRALTETSHAITSAALIMVSVFAVIAALELPIMKQLGVGLAIAILLDATIVRSLLLPASMVLLGRWNWYFPRWLEWLPDLEREAARGAAESKGG